MQKRVVITGAGVLGPIGKTALENWENAISGKSGIRRMTIVNPDDFTSKIAGEVKDFDPLDYLDRKIIDIEKSSPSPDRQRKPNADD